MSSSLKIEPLSSDLLPAKAFLLEHGDVGPPHFVGADQHRRVDYAPISTHVTLDTDNRSQMRCMTRSPTAKSTGVVIVETFESHSTGRNPSRLSLPALVAAAYVQSTERPGPRIQMAGFICGSPMNRG